MPQTLEHPDTTTPKKLPLILDGAAAVELPTMPDLDWDEQRQIMLIKGTDTAACTVPEAIAGTLSTALPNNIRDEDDNE